MGEAFITRRGGNSSSPSIFGDGSHGDFYLAAGQTHIEPVPVPHQSVVVKQYKSFTMEPGSVYKCSAHNAGLVIRVKGDCNIKGTIDQSGMAPKTNPNNNYPYPPGLACGNGGNGGAGGDGGGNWPGEGGTAMIGRIYGGGYGAGGGGGWASAYATGSDNNYGNNGGSCTSITVNTPEIFIANNHGGGGQGAYYGSSTGGVSGTGAGGYGGNSNAGGGGAAGNYGGGVILLYTGGKLMHSGAFVTIGYPGGTGGNGGSSWKGSGGGGGGGGGGGVYILWNQELLDTGRYLVDGGAGGASGTAYSRGYPGAAGQIGTITIKKYEKGDI